MSSQLIQLNRLIRAIEALRKQPLRTVQLADILECSERTALRILEAIGGAGLRLTSEERREPRGRSFERYYLIE
jgi:predicted ArsR family transcriptional regulator